MSKAKTPITDALEDLAEALAAAGIPPGAAELTLALDDWRALSIALNEENPGKRLPGDVGRVEVAGIPCLIRFR